MKGVIVMEIPKWVSPLFGTLVLVSYDVVLPVVVEGSHQKPHIVESQIILVQRSRQEGQEEVDNKFLQYNSNSEIVAEISGSQSTNEEEIPEVRIPIEYSRENNEKALWVFNMQTHMVSKIVPN
jgi:hypothetical protein